MKKVYMAPQTEAIKLMSGNAIMAVSSTAPNFQYGEAGQGGAPR